VIITPELSVVVLCYRSELHLLEFVDELSHVLDSKQVIYQVVLVANFDADQTADRTPEIAKSIALRDKRVTVVAQPKRGMMGWDLISGLEATTGNVIAFVDGDGQTPATDIVKVYRKLIDENLEFCQIFRQEREDTLVRRVLSRIFNILFKIVFPSVQTRDVNGKPKIFTRHAYEKMKISHSGWFVDAEIILEITRLKFRSAEIPGRFLKNSWRKSFIGPLAILEFLLDLGVYRVIYWFRR